MEPASECCYICLDDSAPTVSTGCGCTSLRICKGCAGWFRAPETYARCVAGEAENPEYNVIARVNNPLASIPSCSTCKRQYSGEFLKGLKTETLKLLLDKKAFPRGPECVNAFYAAKLMVEVQGEDLCKRLDFRGSPEALDGVMDTVFDGVISGCWELHKAFAYFPSEDGDDVSRRRRAREATDARDNDDES